MKHNTIYCIWWLPSQANVLYFE